MQTSLRRLRCLAFIFVSLTVLWLRAGSQPRLREAAGFQLSSQSCSACHQAIFDGFVRTAHFQTSSRADERSWRDGLLYQLPVSWLVEPAAWMNSPGYEDGKINFDRLIPPRCLECHSSSFKLERTATGVRYAGDYEVGISCGACHGDGSRHAGHHAANPGEKVSRFMLNTARFERERKLDGCALCHSGPIEAKRPPFSYRPGERLDDYFYP